MSRYQIEPANPARAAQLYAERRASICGWTADAEELLADYDGDLPAFTHDCTIQCAGCNRRWFAGHGQQDIELNRNGEFICAPCERLIWAERAGSIDDASEREAA